MKPINFGTDQRAPLFFPLPPCPSQKLWINIP